MGKMISETELIQMCDCTMFGTEAFQAVNALRKLGFVRSGKYNLTIPDLEQALSKQNYPIVYVALKVLSPGQGLHAMVVVEIDNKGIQVLDPLNGMCLIDKEIFNQAWQLTNGLTILIEH
jgi:ABC-type bacteriocin/lantibiotic exporter with double-glycine peptidase domain